MTAARCPCARERAADPRLLAPSGAGLTSCARAVSFSRAWGASGRTGDADRAAGASLQRGHARSAIRKPQLGGAGKR